jgi:hypothetical protein
MKLQNCFQHSDHSFGFKKKRRATSNQCRIGPGNCVIFAKDAAVRMLEAARIQMFLILLKRSQTIYVKLILLKQDKKKQLLNQKQSLWDHT